MRYVSHDRRRVGSSRVSALLAEEHTGTSTDRRVSILLADEHTGTSTYRRVPSSYIRD